MQRSSVYFSQPEQKCILSATLGGGGMLPHTQKNSYNFCILGVTALDAAIYRKRTAVIALLLAHIAQTEGAEAADKAEVGAVLGTLVFDVENKNKKRAEEAQEK